MQLEQKRFRFFNSTCWFYVVLVCLLVLPSLALSENRVEAERQNWEIFINRDIVSALLLSDDGKAIWAGTNGGLEKRDAITGKLIKLFTNLNGLPGNTITSLVSDNNGGLWIGTDNGLAHLKSDDAFDVLNWVIWNDNISGLPAKNVLSLLPDGSGGLWIGTNGGLARLKSDGTREIFSTENLGLTANCFSSLLSDGNGGLWNGGCIFSRNFAHLRGNGTWEILKLPDNVTFIYALASDDNGGVWIGTNGGGLVHLKNDGYWEIFDKDNSELPDNDIYSLLSDGKGGLWIGCGGVWNGTDGGGRGLVHFRYDGTCKIFNSDNSGLPDNKVVSLLSDGSGGLWIGTYRGLTHWKPDDTWEVFCGDGLNKTNAGLPDNFVTSLLSDTNGRLWVGTKWGDLASFNPDGIWQDILKNDLQLSSSILLYSISSLLSDGCGGLWVGTGASVPSVMGIGENWGYLALFKANGTWEEFNSDNSEFPDSFVTSLLPDDRGGLWVGTMSGGLIHYKLDEPMEIFNYYDNSSLPAYNIKSLLSDGKGGIWFGTGSPGPGLVNFKSDGTWEVFNENNSGLPSTSISSLLSDEKGGLWIGTSFTGLVHFKSDGKWEVFNEENSGLPDRRVSYLLSDNNGGIWISTYDYRAIGSDITHLKANGTWEVLNDKNSGLPEDFVKALMSDGRGGLWIGTASSGLTHFLQIGSPEQIIKPDSPEITINWFLKSSSFDYQNVKYIELQRSLSQDGVYETVLDASDKLIRFYADYSICPKPRVDNCWVTVEGHTPETRTNSDGSTTKGYTLNTPITDPEWLEGLPRYYRLSAVIEEDGKLVRVTNNSEAALITPQVEEKPRVELTLDRNAIAMLPNTNAEITVFVSSLDLFRGDVSLEIESGDGVANSNIINAKLEPSTVSLKAGETKPVLLTIDAFTENTQTIKIIPKIQSGYSGKSTSLNVQVGDGTTSMIALSIAHKTKRSRVLDFLTISGNVIPAQAGQKVVISGNNIKESADSSNASESDDTNQSLTLTTDENGYFQGSVTPIHAGLLTLTAQSNGITSNDAEIFILPARTNIALSSNVNQSTKKGDTLRVQGIITPVRLDGTKVNLDIRYLDPANQDAGLQPQFVGGVEIDANGVFYRDVVVSGNGFINVKASLPETSDYLSINTKLVIPIGQPVGEGIIVVSESGDADFQTISKNLGNYVYNALKSRNIPAERIKYLGISDDPKFTNGTANKANLHDALTNWATSLFSTDDPYKTPLNLYLIGKVEDDNNGFRLNDSEVLTADDLAQYLNEAEEIIKTNSKDNYSEYKGFPVTIVLEGTQSGKWIEKIAGNGRIILTSSSDKPVDEGGFAGYDNLGESSFSRYFYEFINYGSDIEGSFAEASYEILKFYRHKQRPVMDADGDGVGTTTEYDRHEASGKFIEYRPSGNLRPQIRTTNPDMTINRRIRVSGSQSDVDNPILWAIATDPENEMGGVFCSISSITDPSNRTVNIEMQQKSDKVNVYEADLSHSYPNLSTGCYQAVYYAKDKAGNVSLPEEKFINVIASSGVLLEAPKMKITTNGNMVTISWSEVANAYGYRLFYCNYPDCSPADIGEIDMGKQREITFDGRGFAFYGAVKAYNSNGLSGWSNVEFFNLR